MDIQTRLQQKRTVLVKASEPYKRDPFEITLTRFEAKIEMIDEILTWIQEETREVGEQPQTCRLSDVRRNISQMSELLPGSDNAIKAGCLCPVIDNQYGAGYGGDGTNYVYSFECPVHNAEFNQALAAFQWRSLQEEMQ